MSFPQARRAPAHAKQVEPIDLTLSSPEPEPQPRPGRKTDPSRPAYRQPAHLKTEPTTEPKTGPKTGPGTSAYRHQIPSSHRTEHRRPKPARRHPPRVHPDHLSRIVNTTDPHVLRALVLHLCTLSPALSGAVARGLAHNSTFAQATIVKYHPAQTKPDPRRAQSASPASDFSELLSSPKIPSPIKHDRKPSPAPSHSSSSTAFSDSLPLRPLTHVAASSSSPRRAVSNANPEPAPTTKTCIHCHKPFDYENGFCTWHPGSKARSADGAVQWDCCGALPWEAGCESANAHVAASQNPSINAEPRPKTMTCAHCRQPYTDENVDSGCSFHAGEKVMTAQRTVEWTCCGGGLRESGCSFEDFHVPAHVQDMPKKRTPSYGSPSFRSRPPKNPRLF
ncbi:hypothetical protein K505DRAFT_330942 [Melanomma pulvis-pyrius CBS 109.77]|uniref:Uncharacterized protein n=1 Tax=Melanomma pulvis-pyrius CBS 109.77 TaxID=1314802 RepID=A0A6A6WN94_9PLEO|nr:hypothetical protein K505DRAFT_330942 [Melanomma pulvis-pyrius CBS 109.77]